MGVWSCRTQLSWISKNLVSMETFPICDDSRIENKHHTSHSGQKIAKKVENFQLKLFFLQFLCCRSQPKPARAAHQRFRANTYNPIPQCFQTWQVSAKYCTFLDFLPSVMPIVHKSFGSTHQC